MLCRSSVLGRRGRGLFRGPAGRFSDAETARYTEWIANNRQLHRAVEQMREVAEQARGIILAAEQGRSSAP
jgi:hypothetical protein